MSSGPLVEVDDCPPVSLGHDLKGASSAASVIEPCCSAFAFVFNEQNTALLAGNCSLCRIVHICLSILFNSVARHMASCGNLRWLRIADSSQ